MSNVFKRIAGGIAAGGILRRGRKLWEQNRLNLQMPLSKWDKLSAGLYLVLSDYATGHFPPRAGSREEVHEQEVNFGEDLPGTDSSAIDRMELSKPFWAGNAAQVLRDSASLFDALKQVGVRPPMTEAAKVLRPGGWFFVLSEPNRIHTITSYRMAVLTNTLERGFCPSALKQALKESGFGRIVVLKNRFHFGVRHLWYAAEKTSLACSSNPEFPQSDL